MIPDYTMELCFSETGEALVRSRVADLCDHESAGILRELPFDDAKVAVEICLLAPPDAPQEMLDGFSVQNGVSSCGIVDLEYSPTSQYSQTNGSFSLEFWPRTRRLQYIFFASMTFRAQITKLLAECGGTWGAIVFESSFPIEFWSRERGRFNDERPDRQDGKLLLPSELNS
jgi:hypothetical protein